MGHSSRLVHSQPVTEVRVKAATNTATVPANAMFRARWSRRAAVAVVLQLFVTLGSSAIAPRAMAGAWITHDAADDDSLHLGGPADLLTASAAYEDDRFTV